MGKEYKYDVFISYSRRDTAMADEIIEAFEEQGITYFIDRHSISGGLEFPAELAKAIKASRIFLFLASKNSYESKFTMTEVVYAFNRKENNCIIPYIIDGSSLPDNLEFTFSAINRRNLKDHPIKTVLIDDVLRRLGKSRIQTTQDVGNNENIVKPQQGSNQLISGFKLNGKTVGFMVLAASVLLLLLDLFLAKGDSILGDISMLSLFVLLVVMIIGYIRPASLCLSNRSEVSKFYLASFVICLIANVVCANRAPVYDMETVEEPYQEEVVATPQEPATETNESDYKTGQPAAADAPAAPAGSSTSAANDDYMKQIEAANAMQQRNAEIIDNAASDAAALMNDY